MIAFPSNWMLFYPLAFSLFVALRMHECRVGSGGDPHRALAIRVLITVMFVLVLLSAGLRTTILGAIWFILAMLFTLILWWKSRRLQRTALLRAAMQMERPEHQHFLASAYYAHNRGSVRKLAGRLLRDLRAGVSWWNALEHCGVARTSYEHMAVRLRSHYGRDAELVKQQRPAQFREPLEIQAAAEALWGRCLAFGWVWLGVPVIGLLLVIIIPSLVELAEEFSTELPPAMQLVANFADADWRALLTAPFAMLCLGLLACAATASLLWLFPSLMRLPGMRILAQPYYLTLGFTALAQATQRDADLGRACRRAAELMPVDFVADRFLQAAELLQSGVLPARAFQSAGLIRPREARRLEAVFQSDSLAASLQRLSQWKTERLLNRYSAGVQLAGVTVTLMMAAVVGVLAFAVMQTLTILINELA